MTTAEPATRTTLRDVQLSAFPEIAPDKPVGPIPASVQGGTNADLMFEIAPLYLTGSVLDVTYGEGKWWDRFTPHPFTFHDLHKVDGVDFRALPEADQSIDTVCFDPPYIISGGKSAAMPEFQDAYGIGGHNLQMTNSEGGNVQLHDLIHGGIDECARVARTWLLVKCMEFAQGGGVNNAFGSDFHDIPYGVTKWALEAGFIKHDQIVHHAGSGPGGHNIWDVKRARRHHSYLIVFRRKGPPMTARGDAEIRLCEAQDYGRRMFNLLQAERAKVAELEADRDALAEQVQRRIAYGQKRHDETGSDYWRGYLVAACSLSTAEGDHA